MSQFGNIHIQSEGMLTGGQQIAAGTSGLVCLCQPEGAGDISQNEQCRPQRTSKEKHLRKAFQAGGIAYAKALNLEAG